MKTKPIMKTAALSILLLTLYGVRTRAADAGELWEKNCASCHGKDGRGDTKMGKKVNVKDYTDPKFQAEFKDDKAAKTIKEGITENGKERMKPFAEKLTDDDIKALIAHIRTFKK